MSSDTIFLKGQPIDAASRHEHMELETFVVPNFTVKELLSVIPAHCFERSTLKSSWYVLQDVLIIASLVCASHAIDPYISPEYFDLPHPALYRVLKWCLWTLYGFCAGLAATGLWVIAHECGHQAYSTSKTVNNTVGWILHSGLGIPYHSWRISHAKHHAHTSHMTEDQAWVPYTRSDLSPSVPALNAEGEDLAGSTVSEKVQAELFEALGDSPLGATIWSIFLLVIGFQGYLVLNLSGQGRYPKGTNHFNPFAQYLFRPSDFAHVVVSDIGIGIWLGVLYYWVHQYGWNSMLSYYFVPYLWVNHWLVLMTFLQHTDPLLPHYRVTAFTFPRGALSTMDRVLMGGPGITGSIMAWFGSVLTHGVAETHVLHHVASKIPHYHAEEASAALHALIQQDGLYLKGLPATWGEFIRTMRSCKFVEDTGEVVFYKNARGFAKRVAVFDGESSASASDSGVELDSDEKKPDSR